MNTVTLSLTNEQLEFLKQLMNADQLSVQVKHAKVASEVYALIQNANAPPP